jgi:hypothetical protein
MDNTKDQHHIRSPFTHSAANPIQSAVEARATRLSARPLTTPAPLVKPDDLRLVGPAADCRPLL